MAESEPTTAASVRRCGNVDPKSKVRCEREAGHTGWHMHGTETDAAGLTAWGNWDDAMRMRDVLNVEVRANG